MTCELCEDCPFAETSKKTFHEVHVTVETDREDDFFAICKQNGIKAVVIIDFRSETDRMKHIMTSQKLEGTDSDALAELARIKEIFLQHGFVITREKIETNLNADRDYSKGYFESHLGFVVNNMDAFKRILTRIGGLRLSQNALKKTNLILATVREYNTTPEQFLEKMKFIRSRFFDYGYETDKLIIEYCYLDTNENQDEGWKVY